MGFVAEIFGLSINAIIVIALLRLGLSKLGLTNNTALRLLLASFLWFVLVGYSLRFTLAAAFQAPELWGYIYASFGALFGLFFHLLLWAIEWKNDFVKEGVK